MESVNERNKLSYERRAHQRRLHEKRANENRLHNLFNPKSIAVNRERARTLNLEHREERERARERNLEERERKEREREELKREREHERNLEEREMRERVRETREKEREAARQRKQRGGYRESEANEHSHHREHEHHHGHEGKIVVLGRCVDNSGHTIAELVRRRGRNHIRHSSHSSAPILASITEML